MTKWTNAAVLIGAAALWQGCATDQSPSGATQMGRVEQVYVEAYPGVYVDNALASVPGDKPRWVSLSFPKPLDDGRRRAVALLDTVIAVEPGDLVQVHVADQAAFNARGEPDTNRITALLVRRDHPNAATFGQQPPAPADSSIATEVN